jgi:hypothetical protein
VEQQELLLHPQRRRGHQLTDGRPPGGAPRRPIASAAELLVTIHARAPVLGARRSRRDGSGQHPERVIHGSSGHHLSWCRRSGDRAAVGRSRPCRGVSS